MNKVITPDLTHAGDPAWVEEVKKFLEEHVTKAQRQQAKMANFGLPGGMGARMFYQHCREGGLNITREETDFMRDAWIATFSEMQRHMQPKPIPPSDKIRRKYGFVPDDDDEFEDPDQGRQLFIAHCIDGFTRNRASRNAALNVQFQALVAHGAKVAGLA